jgi:hypothetical protein
VIDVLRSTLPSLFFAGALLLHGGAARAQEVDTFLLVNGLQTSIVDLRLSPPGDGIWGDNLLSPPQVEPGEARQVTARPFAQNCVQDIRAQLAGVGESVEWQSVRLCGIKKLGLFRDGSTGRGIATYE